MCGAESDRVVFLVVAEPRTGVCIGLRMWEVSRIRASASDLSLRHGRNSTACSAGLAEDQRRRGQGHPVNNNGAASE